MDIRVKFGNSALNRGRVIHLFADRSRVTHFYVSFKLLIAFCSRPEAANDVVSGTFMELTVPNKCVKFRHTCLNRSGEILPKAVAGGIFGQFCELR